jgi:hypothetical protein
VRRDAAKVRELVDKAATTNQRRDEQEIAVGFQPPAGGDDAGLLRTAMCAFVAGMAAYDWNAVAEGYVMLRQLHHRAYKAYYNPLP